ncbi:MAG: hypothetical protein R3B70_06455 [Polyangiaceae bacterium]
MDRKGWAADRSRMFQKKMVVTAEEISISPAPSMAEVLFTQTWSSGSYRMSAPSASSS